MGLKVIAKPGSNISPRGLAALQKVADGIDEKEYLGHCNKVLTDFLVHGKIPEGLTLGNANEEL